MRFLLDMGVNVGVVEWLRGQGHDAKHLREEGLQRLPNGEIFKKAAAEDRVILTLDLDFGEIAACSRGSPASVIIFRLKNTRRSHLIERLDSVLPRVSEDLEAGAIVTIEESRHRIRELPVF